METSGSGHTSSQSEDRQKELEEALFWRTEELNARNEELNAQTKLLLRHKQELESAKQLALQGQRRLEQLVSSIGSVLIGLDSDLRVTQWNIRAEQIFGRMLRDVDGESFSKVRIPWDWNEVLEKIDECLRTGSIIRVNELPYERLDGAPGFLSLTINPIKGAEGVAQGLVLIAEELTEHHMLETQLAQSQKLESIGQLAAGVAHEINTPIQYVGDNTRFFKDSIADIFAALLSFKTLLEANKAGQVGPEVIGRVEEAIGAIDLEYLETEIPRAIEQTLDGVERVANIVRAMKEFSHPDQVEKSSTDLNKAIQSTITISRNEWKYVADLFIDLDPDLPPVDCLAGELNQVVLNMIVNAAHAIADRVGTAGSEKGEIRVGTRRQGNNVEITVGDSGAGIPKAIQKRIFDPFFTTKGVGRGTGQGLAIAHTVIVNKHGGTISFDSIEKVGTTFTITLPIRSS
jgi:PAS domain S-box-containing protein